MRMTGVNSENTKKTNRLLVLRMLCSGENISRIQIASKTGLTKMTVTNIVNEYLDSGVICETEPLPSQKKGAGRRQRGLMLSPTAPLVIGLWISRDFCVGILSTLDLGVLAQLKIDLSLERNFENVIDEIEKLILKLKKSTDREILGVGIATVGPLDILEGVILNPPNFFGIKNYPITKELEKRTNLLVLLQNDMNASALAEIYGSSQYRDNFVYVGLTNGVGAGIVLNGRLFEGTRGFAGELGHTIVSQQGERCHCGNVGCLETFVSVPNLIKAVEKDLGKELDSFEELCKLSKTDNDLKLALERSLKMLSVGLVNLVNLFDPCQIIIGHEGSFLDCQQLERIESAVNQSILAKEMANVEVITCSFGEIAPVYGGAATVLEQVFEGNLLYDRLYPYE